MLPRADQRIWIIVFCYLLLKCSFTNIMPRAGALGSATDDGKARKLPTGGTLENLYHRMLDNDEFNGMFYNVHGYGPDVAAKASPGGVDNSPDAPTRGGVVASPSQQINVAYSNLDNLFSPIDRHVRGREVAIEHFEGYSGSDEAAFFSETKRVSSTLHTLQARTGRSPGGRTTYRNGRPRRSLHGVGAAANLQASAIAAPEVSSTSTSVPPIADVPRTASIANGDDSIFSRVHLETAADVPLHTIDFSNIATSRSGVQHGPSRRTTPARSGDPVRKVDEGRPAVSSNVKVSNLKQLISEGPAVGRSKMDSTGRKDREVGSSPGSRPVDTLETKQLFGTVRESKSTAASSEELVGRPLSRSPRPSFPGEPRERAITTSHSSLTSDGQRYRERTPDRPDAAFILLDDSVYIAPAPSLRGNGSQAQPDKLPSAGTDLMLDSGARGGLFGGRNFDEQIIFLNGPDLLETSVEQESSSPAPSLPRRTGRRSMGKVTRAVWTNNHADDDGDEDEDEDDTGDQRDGPLALPLRPIVRDPAEAALVVEDNVVLVYADQHETVRLNCEVDADITSSVWLKDGQIVHAMDKKSRTADIRFVREPFGGLTIRDVMLEDDGVWQCEAENARGFFFNGRPIKLIVLDPPKEPYLLIDSRRLDAGNMFIPVKENSELTLACVSEGGNPKPTLTWEVLLSPGIDRHAQKLPNDVLELQEIKKDKDQDQPYRINSGAVSEAKLAAVYRVHHQARILCIMEHPTLKVRQNASLLLDVQYTPSFAITRAPGFGYPLREGIEVSLKCDVDSNPPSTPLWQKDDGDTPVPQTGDGFLNFSSIRREHSGWYKCTSRHLNFQYSSIGYYLSVRYEPIDVTSEPVEQDLALSQSSSSSSAGSSPFSASSSSVPLSNGAGTFKTSATFGSFPAPGAPLGSSPFKPGAGGGQMEVELGGSVTLQCPQGSLGCWSHLDAASVRLKGPGSGSGGSRAQTGQLSLKDVVYQDAGTYKCVGQGAGGRKKPDAPRTGSAVKAPTLTARNATPSVLPGASLHLSVEFCANPPASAARWLHGDRVYTPGNQYGSDVVAYGLTDLPTPACKEARLTYVHMAESVPRRFYFVVSSPGGVAEAVFNVNYTLRPRAGGASPPSPSSGRHGNSFPSSPSGGSAPPGASSSSGAANVNIGGLAGYKLGTHTVHSVPGNGLDDNGEQLMDPEEIHFPIFGTGGGGGTARLGLPVAVATLASALHWHRILCALPLLLPVLLLSAM